MSTRFRLRVEFLAETFSPSEGEPLPFVNSILEVSKSIRSPQTVYMIILTSNKILSVSAHLSSRSLPSAHVLITLKVTVVPVSIILTATGQSPTGEKVLVTDLDHRSQIKNSVFLPPFPLITRLDFRSSPSAKTKTKKKLQRRSARCERRPDRRPSLVTTDRRTFMAVVARSWTTCK